MLDVVHDENIVISTGVKDDLRKQELPRLTADCRATEFIERRDILIELVPVESDIQAGGDSGGSACLDRNPESISEALPGII